jgi:hypothetical protein
MSRIVLADHLIVLAVPYRLLFGKLPENRCLATPEKR